MESNISYIAVLVAAIGSMVVGFIWYGVLFKKQWMLLMGITPESIANMKMSANKAYAIQFVASLFMACVLGNMIVSFSAYKGVEGLIAGVHSGFWVWLGFVVPITLGTVLWENKSWKLWLINSSHYLVSLIVMGIILSLWG